MIIGREENAPVQCVGEPNKRQLKVLISPFINEGLHELAVGMTIVEKGSTSEPHAHIEGELFFVISGRGRIVDDNETEALEPGTAVFSPAYHAHQLINDGESELKVLWVLVPPGREKAILDNSK